MVLCFIMGSYHQSCNVWIPDFFRAFILKIKKGKVCSGLENMEYYRKKNGRESIRFIRRNLRG